MKREKVLSELEMTLIDKLFYKEHSGYDSVYGSLVESLVRDGDVTYYKISI